MTSATTISAYTHKADIIGCADIARDDIFGCNGRLNDQLIVPIFSRPLIPQTEAKAESDEKELYHYRYHSAIGSVVIDIEIISKSRAVRKFARKFLTLHAMRNLKALENNSNSSSQDTHLLDRWVLKAMALRMCVG